MKRRPRERRQELIEYLVVRGFVSVAEICERFGVSEMTARRDLAWLKEQGLLDRVAGGATPTDMTYFRLPIKARSAQFAEEKVRIGAKAAEFVADGDHLLIDGGSTTAEVAHALHARSGSVVTNALNVASHLVAYTQWEIHVLGGQLSRTSLCFSDPESARLLEHIRVRTFITGAEGVDLRGGLTVSDVREAHSKRLMMQCATRTIVVADHSKLGRTTLAAFADLSEIECLITGVEADPAVVESLRTVVEVMQV